MAHRKTYHEGAQDERDAWMRKIKRMLNEKVGSGPLRVKDFPGLLSRATLNALLKFGKGRAKRFREREGGL